VKGYVLYFTNCYRWTLCSIIDGGGPLGGKMNKSNNLYRDIFTGITFTAGMFVFMSDEFIVSTMLFCLASISSNLDFGSSLRAWRLVMLNILNP